jgi:hypothetical protein
MLVRRRDHFLRAAAADLFATRDWAAWREAGHATIARALGLGVPRASASADDPHVVTLRVGASTQFTETVKTLLVDLAGPLVERRATGRSDDLACRADEQNALRRALWLVRNEYVSLDEELDDDRREEAEAQRRTSWR